ncbi:MAG: flavodoxin family protein [Candidatus Thermoplasmatota archaeon]|nr:flavodoxin family protein [Candidatus Thermoplasmatota archaeon]
MKILVVYDTVHGNTQKIADAMGGVLGGDARVVRADQVDPRQLDSIDLLVIGSPTHGGKPTEPVQKLLDGLPDATVEGLRFASFDTRVPSRIAKIFGYAADKISKNLTSRGGGNVSSPMGFFVSGTKGPLKDGELERAANWAREIAR